MITRSLEGAALIEDRTYKFYYFIIYNQSYIVKFLYPPIKTFQTFIKLRLSGYVWVEAGYHCCKYFVTV